MVKLEQWLVSGWRPSSVVRWQTELRCLHYDVEVLQRRLAEAPDEIEVVGSDADRSVDVSHQVRRV